MISNSRKIDVESLCAENFVSSKNGKSCKFKNVILLITESLMKVSNLFFMSAASAIFYHKGRVVTTFYDRKKKDGAFLSYSIVMKYPDVGSITKDKRSLSLRNVFLGVVSRGTRGPTSEQKYR